MPNVRRRGWILAAWLNAAAVALGGSTGCRGGETSAPDDGTNWAQKEVVRLRRHLEQHPQDSTGWRDLAHLHWLHTAEVEEAIPILDKLAENGDSLSRFSRATIARTRMQSGLAAREALGVLEAAAAEQGDAVARMLAEPAARLVQRLHGHWAGDDAAVVAFTDRVRLSALGAPAAQILSSLRASIERRFGREYRSYFDAQGCVLDWEVGRVEGKIGALDLGRLEPGPGEFVLDPGATTGVLSCAVRLHNPLPHPGVRRARVELEVPTERLHLELSAQKPMRAYIDGQLLTRTDRGDRWTPRHHWLEVDVVPGPHVLEIHTAIPDERAWILVRATDAAGLPIHSKPLGPDASSPASTKPSRIAVRKTDFEGLRGRIYRPLRSYLVLEDALSDGDSRRAESVVRKLPDAGWEFAEGNLLLAKFHRTDPSRGRSARRTREQENLKRAVELDAAADQARLLLLQAELSKGEGAGVVAQLKKLGSERLASPEGELLRWRVFLERGSDYLAEQALGRAAKLHPESCEVLSAQRQMARRRDRAAREDELTALIGRCPGTLSLRAHWAERRGRRDLAREHWHERLARAPDDVEAMESLAGLAVADRNYEEALSLHAKVLEIAPFRLSSRVARADLLARAGRNGEARKELRGAIALLPHSSRLREMGRSVGLEDDLWSWRADGTKALSSYQKRGGDYDGAGEVLVLDRDVARVYENGGQRHIIHQIVHLLSKAALDRYGEMSPPNGAAVLTLHSIKPDGTILEPELIAGKDGLSLRNLEIGDFVEYEYALDVDPSASLPGYADLSRFRFQSLDVPYHVSELVVLYPATVSLEVESRNQPPKAETMTRGDTQVMKFRAEEMVRRGAEPQHRSLVDELPMVRVYTQLDLEVWLDILSDRLRAAPRTNLELEALARSLVKGKKSERAGLGALWAWITENIEEGGDLSTGATRTLANRRGNRLMLLRAMLEVSEIRSELWLLRDKFGPRRLEQGHPMPEAFDTPALAVWPDQDQKPLIVMTVSRVMPLGYIAPAYADSEALRVWLAPGDRASGEDRTPPSPSQLADLRSYELVLHLDEHGDGALTGEVVLQGLEAMTWREILKRVDPDRVEEVFQQMELANLLQGATLDLEQVEIDHETELMRPLVLRFSARAKGVGVRQGGELVVRSDIVPMNIGMGYTRLPSRWSGLVIPYAPQQHARVEINLSGSQFTALPSTERLETEYGSYDRRIEEGGVGQSRLVVSTQSVLTLGIVTADRYQGLAGFTRALEAAERAVFRAR